MNWDAISAVGEILGAVAVVISLVYLATQIRQNSRSVNIESERFLNESWNTIQRDLATDEGTADIINRGLNDYVSLAPAEKGVFHSRVANVMNHQYSQRRMRASGGGDPDFAEKIDVVAASILNSAGGKQWWHDVGSNFVHYSYVQDYMSKNGADLAPLTDLSPWQRESSG